ncbi:hypothetical protein [Streptomyces sp. NRRL S-920]|uniref:hypothetical protein n=1 Tax=Streptomyces sp. NRRL S-920 TaxID=1463921 RepID=UPI0004C8DCE4|nr:hypothetical protein [Streptomyces sp. NRRL S-920]
MTRYGFAIKALPKGGKPFEDDDEDQDQDAADITSSGAPPIPKKPNEAPESDAEEDASGDTADDAMTTPGPAGEETPADGAAPPEDETAAGAVPGSEDDARPWSGDMYDEGDETEPADAFAAYNGGDGEEAWLDQAPDGTLTGWVRDATGQVWRYTDPDVWAIDVDDAQMTRTHSQGSSGGADGTMDAERGGQDPLFPPKQN